jgi:hypothetical protein
MKKKTKKTLNWSIYVQLNVIHLVGHPKGLRHAFEGKHFLTTAMKTMLLH